MDVVDERQRAVIEAALRRLVTHSMDAVRAMLTASMLCRDASVSRDTAYRAFGVDRQPGERSKVVNDAIVEATTSASIDPDWSGATGSAAAMTTAFLNGFADDGPAERAIIDALEANVEAQFRSPGQPVGWLLQAAALTASPQWQGDLSIQDDQRALAERVLDVRREFYQELDKQFLPLMSEGMSRLRIRPENGMDPLQIVVLMHCLLDGAVLRMFIEPDTLDPRLVATAMVRLARSFSEPGAYHDPRHPDGSDHQSLYDRMVDAAEEQWARGDDATVESAANAAGVSLDVARLFFSTDVDLADSVVRSAVMGGGGRGETVGTLTVAHLAGALHRLALVADRLPNAVALTTSGPPKHYRSFVDDLVIDAAAVIEANSTMPALSMAKKIVALAGQGTVSWPGVEAIIEVLNETAADVDQGARASE